MNEQPFFYTLKETAIGAEAFDAPWKIGLELFLEPFLLLCFPKVHALIDWRTPPAPLDKELQQIAPTSYQGVRFVDKLFRVRLLDGREEWLLIHVEVQAQVDREFPERMWVYYYRIWDTFRQRLISLAVLADDQPDWRPASYRTELAGCILHFQFPIFKVIEREKPEAIFEETGNPFALLVAAHQGALQTRNDPEARFGERLRLVRFLYKKGLDRKQITDLFRLIAWLTRLPRDLELRFHEEISKLEGNKDMTTTDSILSAIELMAMEKGRQEGLEEARRQDILDALEARFGALPSEARAKLQGIGGEDPLRQAHRRAITSPSLEHFLETIPRI